MEISYRTWYNIEEDWDYVYVEASTNGEDWQILNTQVARPIIPLVTVMVVAILAAPGGGLLRAST